ncbi:MAG TPA: hypothetical protein VHI72_15625 [Hyphomicrobiaceae bacterium]|nr:hypothetical protein [Hyphomicrobiaceae bacterium]
MRVPGGVFAMAAVLAAGPAAANPVKSLYTTVELKSCKPLKRHKDGDAWRCEGLPGYPVYVAAGDLRQFVSAGKNAEYRRAATQTLGPFNTIFENGHQRATIEWRFALRAGVQIPYATIVRYHTSRQGRSGDVLVISKVTPQESCHVAYIDALANADAIALARRVADEQARTFDCRQEPRAMGERGKSPM